MDTAVLCTSCHWFGVYRADVIGQIAGCPSCGSAALSARDLADDTFREIGSDIRAPLDERRKSTRRHVTRPKPAH